MARGENCFMLCYFLRCSCISYKIHAILYTILNSSCTSIFFKFT